MEREREGGMEREGGKEGEGEGKERWRREERQREGGGSKSEGIVNPTRQDYTHLESSSSTNAGPTLNFVAHTKYKLFLLMYRK